MSLSRKDLAAMGYEIIGDTAVKKAAKPAEETPRPRRKAAIRMPSKREPNKTERRLEQRLQCVYDDSHRIIYEGLSFRLNAGTSYTPDYIVMRGGEIVAAYECKGPHLHQSAAASKEKFKQATAEYPHIRFIFAQWSQGEWLLAGAEEPKP